MAEQNGALVVYGSTGRRILITMQDLEMPDNIKQKKNAAFFAKQWNSVASFWYNRVLKENNLQRKTVADLLQLIEGDIEKRWNKRKMESALHKKKKRILEGNTNAGKPSSSILITNICSYSSYLSMTVGEMEELKTAIREKIESFDSVVLDSCVIVDDAAELPDNKKVKTEAHSTPDTNGGDNIAFDDTVAFTCKLDSKEAAANVIARLHGAQLNNRAILCRFWSS